MTQENKEEYKNEKGEAMPKTIIRATSYKLPDGRLAEMVYDKTKRKTYFVVGIGNTTEIIEEVEVTKSELLRPLTPHDDMIKLGFIKFPSAVGQYKDNKELFEEIISYIKKYVALPDYFVTIAATYVMMSWVYEKFHTLPYLRVVGMHGTGKTRFLETVGNICYQAMLAGGSASIASVFRTIHSIRGTLVFDEADFRNSEAWNEIVKILNSGHTNDFPVMRVNISKEGEMDTKTFYVFGPKILASRERFGDEALESRCLSQNLLPQNDIQAPIHLPEEFEKETQELRNKLLAFKFNNYNNPILKENSLEGIKLPRLKQSLLAVYNISKIVSKDTEEKILQFAKEYEKELQLYQIRAVECDVLICILELLFDVKEMEKSKGKIRIQAIADKYNYKFNDQFDDREQKIFNADGWGAVTPANYVTSPRKIGHLVTRKLMIRTERDYDGFYIPLSEREKIMFLMSRYGITDSMLGIKKKGKLNTDINIKAEDSLQF